MKNKKSKKEKSKEDKREGTITKILILVIFIILVFYVPDLWKRFDIPNTIERIPWRMQAADNLEARLQGIAGEEYIFVKGTLISNCTKLNRENHCPYRILEAKPSIYADEKMFFFDFDVPIRKKLMNGTGDDIIFELEEPSFLSFLEKGKNIISFLIQDYTPLTNLCRKDDLFVDETICPIKWKKKFRVVDITQKREDIFFELIPPNIQQSNNTIQVRLQGKVKGNLINPSLEVRVYSYSAGQPSHLKKQQEINLRQKEDYSTFNIRMSINIPELRVGYFGTDEKGELINEMKEKQESYLILLLFQDENYFYAKEIIIKGDDIKESTYT